MKEDKQKICDLLLPALQATRSLYDLQELEYGEERELVYAKFESGYQKVVNVAMDSSKTSLSRSYKKKSAYISPARRKHSRNQPLRV